MSYSVGVVFTAPANQQPNLLPKIVLKLKRPKRRMNSRAVPVPLSKESPLVLPPLPRPAERRLVPIPLSKQSPLVLPPLPRPAERRLVPIPLSKQSPLILPPLPMSAVNDELPSTVPSPDTNVSMAKRRRHYWSVGQKNSIVAAYEVKMAAFPSKGKVWCAKEMQRVAGCSFTLVLKWVKPAQKAKRLGVSLRKKRVGSTRGGRFPCAEDKLHQRFLARRKTGMKVVARWLRSNMKDIVRQDHGSDVAQSFKFSGGWLANYSDRKHIAWRKRTKKKSKPVVERLHLIRKCHLTLHGMISVHPLHCGIFGHYRLRDRRAMDEIPLPFLR
jgi:hypothetical protein